MTSSRGNTSRSKKPAVKRDQIIQQIKSPLGFYVLSLLILEGTLSLVLTCSKLSEDHVWAGFECMIGLFVAVVGLVTLLAVRNPEALHGQREDYFPPELDKSALKDQIEDLIYKNVKLECLQKRQNEGE